MDCQGEYVLIGRSIRFSNQTRVEPKRDVEAEPPSVRRVKCMMGKGPTLNVTDTRRRGR